MFSGIDRVLKIVNLFCYVRYYLYICNMNTGEVTSILKKGSDGSISVVYLECCGGCSCRECYMDRFSIEDRRKFCSMHCGLDSGSVFRFFIVRKL